jgi:DNA-directed RNA polymerase alpha subunit
MNLPNGFLPGSGILCVSFAGVTIPVEHATPSVYSKLPNILPYDQRRTARLRIGRHIVSARSSNCLAHYGIDSVEELCRYPSEVLLEARNFGTTSLREIQKALADIGLMLPKKISS